MARTSSPFSRMCAPISSAARRASAPRPTGTTRVNVTGPPCARARIASSRSSDLAVRLATTRMFISRAKAFLLALVVIVVGPVTPRRGIYRMLSAGPDHHGPEANRRWFHDSLTLTPGGPVLPDFSIVTRVAVLDDYQRRAHGYADWASLGSGVPVEFFSEPI